MTKEARIELPQGFEVPKDSAGRIKWKLLSRDPQLLKAVFQAEAQSFYDSVGALDEKTLKEHKRPLLRAIQLRYPGSLSSLRADLEISADTTPKGFWTEERTIQEAEALVKSGGKLTRTQIRKKGLGHAVGKYPGGIQAVRKRLGEENPRKPNNYWQSQDNIKQEALAIIAIYGDLTSEIMRKAGNSSLMTAITRNYPGRLIQLKQDLGIQVIRRSPGYWSPERIEQEAMLVLQQKGELNAAVLSESDRNDLIVAINRSYPGKMRALLEKIGGKPRHKKGYWTLELIEQEAAAFLAKNGALTYALMYEQGRKDLSSAIASIYPGKISALKEKIGFKPGNTREVISTQEANIDLESLFEGGIDD